ncbi:MAG: hypothetical protein FOGNACKC_02266 [Anaerolineae bacterium]|nr:hypothetical protein [Anaerolineae bacterium]
MNTKPRHAEEANYWSTTVHPAKSKGEIEELLDDFGATQQMTAKGQVNGQTAWLIRFVWQGRSYRFTFAPLECRWPTKVASFGGKRRTHSEQAEYQMGRIAVHFVKAVLTAAEAHPHALFGFMELPETAGDGGLPQTAGELDISGVVSALPAPEQFLLAS